MRSNLFFLPTSKLSQDAFFCWLLSWCCESNKRYNSELYYKSRQLLGYLLPAKIFSADYPVHDIAPVVTRAFNHYDCTVYNRTGKSMTLLEIHDFMILRDDSLLDYDRTVERLNEIIGLFNGVVEFC